MFALLLIPNSLLAWAFLDQKPDAPLLLGRAGRDCAASACCSSTNSRSSPLRGSDIAIGLGLTLVGLLGASAANVYQAGKEARRHPLLALLAWSMAIGAVLDALHRLRRRRAAGVRPAARLLGRA